MAALKPMKLGLLAPTCNTKYSGFDLPPVEFQTDRDPIVNKPPHVGLDPTRCHCVPKVEPRLMILYQRCNAPRPMCQVSSSYSLWLPCHCLHVMHLIPCHHVHFICIHVRLMHPSILPVVRFAIRRSYVTRCPFLPLFVCGC